jgi:hypothetical protein
LIVFLPDLVGAESDFFLSRFCHLGAFLKQNPPSGRTLDGP